MVTFWGLSQTEAILLLYIYTLYITLLLFTRMKTLCLCLEIIIKKYCFADNWLYASLKNWYRIHNDHYYLSTIQKIIISFSTNLFLFVIIIL